MFEQHVTISLMMYYGIEIYSINLKAYEGYLSMNGVICTHALPPRCFAQDSSIPILRSDVGCIQQGGNSCVSHSSNWAALFKYTFLYLTDMLPNGGVLAT